MIFFKIRSFFEKSRKRKNAQHLLLNYVGLVPALEGLDIRTAITNFSKTDSDITSKYSLSISLITRSPTPSLIGQDYCPFQDKICNVDAPHHLALVVDDNYTDHPYSAMIAVIGFELRDKSVIVRQIQGGRIKPKDNDTNIVFRKHVGKIRKWILSRLNWEQFLIHILEEWSRQNGFLSVKIQCSINNTWRQDTKEILNLKDRSQNQRLEKHYDSMAENSGYRRGRNYWDKSIASA